MGDEGSVLLGATWQIKESPLRSTSGSYARVEGENAVEIRPGLTWAVPVWGGAPSAPTEARVGPRRWSSVEPAWASSSGR